MGVTFVTLPGLIADDPDCKCTENLKADHSQNIYIMQYVPTLINTSPALQKFSE